MLSEGASVTVAMVVSQFFEVGSNTLMKSASSDGMSIYVFTAYSNFLAVFVLLPTTILYHRKKPPPPIPSSVFYRMFLVSCLGTAIQTLINTGIRYSSPTLASAMLDIIPAFTFILAIISRMENLNLKVHSTQAKIIGTVVSIGGALTVTLYKGIPLIGSGDLRNIEFGAAAAGTYLSSVQSDWILGAFFLATGCLCFSVFLIVQTWVMKDYPQELVVTTICLSLLVILTATVALIIEGISQDWILKTNKELVLVFYNAILVTSLRSVVFTWACRKKGPIYVAMFNPLSMVIALGMGIIFLGDGLYLGSMIGAAIIAIGFYAVMWAQTKEENTKCECEKNTESCDLEPSSSSAPLLC